MCARTLRLPVGVAGGEGRRRKRGGGGGREEEERRKREEGGEERFRPRSLPQANFEAVF